MTKKSNKQTPPRTLKQSPLVTANEGIQFTDFIEGAIGDCQQSGINGWVWDRSKPFQSLTVELLANNEVIAHSVADTFNIDLAERGIGSGKHAFVLQVQSWPNLPLPVELAVRVMGTPFLLWKTVLKSHADLNGLVVSAPVGHVDGIASGQLKGWAFDKVRDTIPLNVDILDNEIVIGTIACTEQRKDLYSAGYSNGNCGFSFDLPISLLDGEMHALSVCYSGTQRRLPNGTFLYGLSKESNLTKFIDDLVKTVHQLQSALNTVEQRLLARHEALLTVQRENMERELQILRKLLFTDTNNQKAQLEVAQAPASSEKLTLKRVERAKRSTGK